MAAETSEKTKTNTNLIERLFAAGAHFGFAKSRRHPTTTPYLFANKQGTDIFDLEKTSQLIVDAAEVMHEAGSTGKTVLFVGTKQESAILVKAAAESVEMPYVTNRWIGGMLTNFSEIKKRIARLNELNEQGESGELERKYTKKERVMIGRELNKLNFNFGGIRALEKAPALLLVVDPRHESIAMSEARDLNIPVIAVSSSDGNLAHVTHPVVVNDALRASVSLVLTELTEAYTEGVKGAAEQTTETKSE